MSLMTTCPCRPASAATRHYLHTRLDALQYELTVCRSPRALRSIEGAILATKCWLDAVQS